MRRRRRDLNLSLCEATSPSSVPRASNCSLFFFFCFHSPPPVISRIVCSLVFSLSPVLPSQPPSSAARRLASTLCHLSLAWRSLLRACGGMPTALALSFATLQAPRLYSTRLLYSILLSLSLSLLLSLFSRVSSHLILARHPRVFSCCSSLISLFFCSPSLYDYAAPPLATRHIPCAVR